MNNWINDFNLDSDFDNDNEINDMVEYIFESDDIYRTLYSTSNEMESEKFEEVKKIVLKKLDLPLDTNIKKLYMDSFYNK